MGKAKAYGRAGSILLALALVLVGAGGARAQDPDSAAQACQRADTSTAWRRTAEAWKAATAGKQPRDPALRQQLLALADSDQAVRQFLRSPAAAGDTAALRRMAAQDSADERALRRMITGRGWPTITQVGVDGAQAAWLTAQHNSDMQQQALRLMRALPPDEVSPRELATLEDRVLVHAGKPQRYGTQLSGAAPGAPLHFDPIEDAAHVDERRARMALPPLDTYVCMVKAAYRVEVMAPK